MPAVRSLCFGELRSRRRTGRSRVMRSEADRAISAILHRGAPMQAQGERVARETRALSASISGIEGAEPLVSPCRGLAKRGREG